MKAINWSKALENYHAETHYRLNVWFRLTPELRLKLNLPRKASQLMFRRAPHDDLTLPYILTN
jgi:hypothetical protein